MPELANVLLANAGAIAVFVFHQWIASVFLSDASIVDRFWGAGFVLVAFITLLLFGQPGDRSWLLLALVTIWGLRLSLYLSWRNWGTGEDYRYQAMRKRFGPGFKWTSLFIVFGFQGFLTWFISLPLQIAFSKGGDSPLAWLDGLGAGIWLAGFLFESIGDWQLARFKARPENEGAVMDRGLWRYTRHPNYFGDALLWWGMFLVALGVPGVAYTVASPALMTFLLMRVSGVPLLERRLRKTRPEYASYTQATSAFIPWPPNYRMRGPV